MNFIFLRSSIIAIFVLLSLNSNANLNHKAYRSSFIRIASGATGAAENPPICLEIENGNTDQIQKMLAEGISADTLCKAIQNSGRRKATADWPLYLFAHHLAPVGKTIEIETLIAKAGANPNTLWSWDFYRGREGSLFQLSATEDIEIVRIFRDHGGDLNLNGDGTLPALNLAISAGLLDVANLLILWGADQIKAQALAAALLSLNVPPATVINPDDIIENFIVALIRQWDFSRDSAFSKEQYLAWALPCPGVRLSVVEQLLSHGASPLSLPYLDGGGSQQANALVFFATQYSRSHGSNGLPFVDSIPENKPQQIKEALAVLDLLSARGDLDVNANGNVVFHDLIYRDYPIDIVRWYITHGVDVNGAAPMASPLVMATWANNVEAMQLLINQGARITGPPINDSLLFIALSGNRSRYNPQDESQDIWSSAIPAVQYLLTVGFHVTDLSSGGETMLCFVKRRPLIDRDDLIQFLTSAGVSMGNCKFP